MRVLGYRIMIKGLGFFVFDMDFWKFLLGMWGFFVLKCGVCIGLGFWIDRFEVKKK